MVRTDEIGYLGKVELKRELNIPTHIDAPRVPSFREFQGSPLPEQLIIAGIVIGGFALVASTIYRASR